MKCNTCNAQWDAPTNGGTTENSCPFCGAILEESAQNKPSSLLGVLSAMYNQYGVELLSDSHRLLAYFVDLAPQLKKEKQLLQHFLSCEGNTKLINALKLPEPDQRKTVNQLLLHMTEVMFISEKVASLVIDSFWQAVGGESFLSTTEADTQKSYPGNSPDNSKTEQSELTSLAQPGSVHAMIELAKKYEHEAGLSGDLTNALLWYLEAAKKWDYYAIYKLGDCMMKPNSPRKNDSEAVEYIKLAAENGCVEAQISLANFYCWGLEVPEDHHKALAWLKEAEENTFDPSIMTDIARSYEELDIEKAVSCYKKASDAGDSSAAYRLGEIYSHGKLLPKNSCLAFSWYSTACSLGHAKSEYILGVHFEYGIGTAVDKEKAFSLYKKAARDPDIFDWGIDDAACKIALCYEDGVGTAIDKNMARKWHPKALHCARRCEDLPKMHPFIQYYLGRCYADGIGVTQDIERASQFMAVASELGIHQAKQWLDDRTKSRKHKWLFWK